MSFKESVKKVCKRCWHLLWKDNSLKGWAFSILFIFIFIRLIFFPGLSLITGTSLPLAIVESCSMYHEGNLLSDFDSWWDRHEDKYLDLNINKSQFEEFSMVKGFNKGDILFVIGANPDKLELGDVVIFNANQRNPIIHRIIEINEPSNGIGTRTFSTIGDNNDGQITFERNIQENQLVGKASFRALPYLGWVKLVFYEWQKQPQDRGFCDEN